jgi:hypothetical protein
MTELPGQEQQPVLNPVSDETGQFDPRFLLWRKFCADHGIPVGTLPGDLSAAAKEQWEEAKASQLGPK